MIKGTEINLIDCAKTYNENIYALYQTNLKIQAGEIVALLGPSGCGKTTMLRIIAGLIASDKGGKVYFDEDDVTLVPIEKRKTGIVFQSYALFPNMSVRQNIAYGLKIKKMSKVETKNRVDEVLELCKLEEFANRSIGDLSGGQQQRVALARAVAPQPRVLLLDEPLSALDASLREHLQVELASLLRKFNITAILVTHDQSEAMAIADRIAVMSQGQILQIDTPENLYANPINSFVAKFVGGANYLASASKVNMDNNGGDLHININGGKLAIPRRLQHNEQIFIRPENIQISATDQAGVVGTIESIIFQGTHYRLKIVGVADDAIIVDYSGSNVPAINDKIGLDIDKDNILIVQEFQGINR